MKSRSVKKIVNNEMFDFAKYSDKFFVAVFLYMELNYVW